MKKLLFVLFFAFIGLVSNAQKTTPRFGTVAGDDNTGRVLTYKYINATDAAGADSLYLVPSNWKTIVRIALTDSFSLKNPSVVKSYAGDNILIIASGASGKKLKFVGSNWLSTGTATLSSVGRAVIQLVFDGAKWVEVDRTVQ
jgi:hypothetical protein